MDNLLIFIFVSVILINEHLLVSESSRSISVSVGEDVTLNCSVDSHITPEHIEEVSSKKTDDNEDILVLLYQNNKTFPDSSHQRYRDRAEFFTAEIPKGNFSLRLKSVRTEDKGVYMCKVLAGGLSANATVVLEKLSFSVSQIMVLILCISASVSALLLFCLIYCRSSNEGLTVRSPSGPLVASRGSSVVLPCYVDELLLMKDLEVEWRRTDSETHVVHVYKDGQAESQQQDYHDRAHFFNDQIQHGKFSLRLDNLRHEDEGPYSCTVSAQSNLKLSVLDSLHRLHLFLVICPNIIMFFAFVFWGVSEDSSKRRILKYGYFAEYVPFSIVVYSVFKEIGIKRGWKIELFDLMADMTFDIVPTLQFILLFYTFASIREASIVIVILPVLLMMTNDRWIFRFGRQICPPLVIRTVMLIFRFVINSVMIILYFKTVENKTEVHRSVPVYLFGSVGLVLLTSTALSAEMILRANGDHTVGDLRFIVFPLESFFILCVLISAHIPPKFVNFLQSCQNAVRSKRVHTSQQNQNTAEKTEDQNETQADSVVSQT